MVLFHPYNWSYGLLLITGSGEWAHLCSQQSMSLDSYEALDVLMEAIEKSGHKDKAKTWTTHDGFPWD